MIPNYLKIMIPRSLEFQAHVVLRGTAASSTHLLAYARMLPLRRASSNVALRGARCPFGRGIFIMRCVELMSARALQETFARAHGDTV